MESNTRLSSLDPVLLKNWRWNSFLSLTVDALSQFNPQSIPIHDSFLHKKGTFGSKDKTQTVFTGTWAC